ncbi:MULTISPECIES: SRPBCC family protein [Streptomyces]|uniref:Polyketide cyclase/dehydrase n=1 Tax=Streptomyces turgidiscabies (strain Car8) TaxID=698760 RepID=L7F3P9_STRT8|nr:MULTISPECIES: SRPBCC family protein [Streptomyces]ELP65606.1 polyketide cyclase/dehydrase [Streptomyces turgidiscabies Car8]MDX3498205.1 SRPBCC family protein [Streptomyces turgidiscabies]GAQ75178.1 polyketide cyclase / dehydrase and lipid transport [Streptomyces turgidiscabies]
MAQSERAGAQDQKSGLDQLIEELTSFLGAQAEQLADKASDKLGDVTDQLQDVAQGNGKLSDVAGIGGRMLRGDSPTKAMAGQGLSSLKDKVTDAASQVFGKSKKGRKSGGKVVNIVEFIDVGLPLRTVYDHWSQYEDFSGFAKGVRDVSRNDDTTSDWKVKVGPSTRGWKATVQEQIPDERIVWTSEGAKGTTRGCVSFHELAPSLTRVIVVVEYYPSGFFEKTGNLWRAQGRRLRLDLKHFLRHVSLTTDEPEGWRGEIRDGEVVVTHEEALEEEDAGEDEGEYEEGAEGEEGDEGDEFAEEEDEEPEEDEGEPDGRYADDEEDYAEEDGLEEADEEDEGEDEEARSPRRHRR